MNASSFVPYYGAYQDWSNVIDLYESGEITFGEAVAESMVIGAVQGVTFGVSLALIPTLGTVRLASGLVTKGPTTALALIAYSLGEVLTERSVTHSSMDVTSGGESVHSVTPTMSSGLLGWIEDRIN